MMMLTWSPVVVLDASSSQSLSHSSKHSPELEIGTDPLSWGMLNWLDCGWKVGSGSENATGSEKGTGTGSEYDAGNGGGGIAGGGAEKV